MDKIRLALELLYYVSGFLLLIVAVIGLKQLKIAKDGIALSAKREAFRLAADQLGQYYLNIIPKFNKLDSAIDQKHLKEILSTATYKIQQDSIHASVPKDAWHAFGQVAPEFVEVFNALESFAVFFTSGVASEEVAFSSVHQTFCD